MKEAVKEELEAQEGEINDSSLFTLPPLSFPNALSISPPSAASTTRSSNDDGAGRSFGGRREESEGEASSSITKSEWSPTTSYSSPLLTVVSSMSNTVDDASCSMRPSSARTRSSSIASDKTQRALRVVSRMNVVSPTASSSSSLNSLTPLASPTTITTTTTVSMSPYSSDTDNPEEQSSSSAYADLSSQHQSRSSPSSCTCNTVLHQRHHPDHHYSQPTHEEQDNDDDGEPDSQQTISSTTTIQQSVATGRASSISISAPSRRRDSKTRYTSSSDISPSTLHCSSSPFDDTPAAAHLSHDHDYKRQREETHSTGRSAADTHSYSLVAVTSASPIRPSPISPCSLSSSSSTTTSHSERRHLGLGLEEDHHHQEHEEHEHETAAHDIEQHNLIKGQQRTTPLSVHSSSQTFDFPSEQIQSAVQGEGPSHPRTLTTPPSLSSLIASSPSLLTTTTTLPTLSYRIPSFGESETLIAALPDSLAKLVVHDLPLSSSPPTKFTIHSAPVAEHHSNDDDVDEDENEDDEEEDTVDSPLDIYDSNEGTATTPPHSRHQNHQPNFNRLSISLPASPTRATSHQGFVEALTSSTSSSTSSRRLPSLHIPLLRASLDLPSVSASSTSGLPLTPLEEIDSPDMRLDSPADLAELSNPFDAKLFADHLSAVADTQRNTLDGDEEEEGLQQQQQQQKGQESNDANEIFYHTLLEFVNSESGYTADLTDLVEVHFSLLSFARFVTEEQRIIIIRDAARLLDLHRRLQEKLNRVDADLGWIREDDGDSDSLPPMTPSDLDVDSPTSEAAMYTPPSPSSRARPFFPGSKASSPKRSSTPGRRFKSSDATVLDAARRISAIFANEAQNLSDAYRPFCSGHSEAMEVVKALSTGSSKPEWDAFESQCTAHLASRKRKNSSSFPSSSSRLHFADFLIKPVQRICRYPLLFGNLVKNAQKTALTKAGAVHVDHVQRYFHRHQDSREYTNGLPSSLLMGAAGDVERSIDRIREALQASKTVAAAVDTAQKLRSLEIATVKLARRIEVQNSDHVSLLNRLDQVVLIGSAHVIYAHAPTVSLQGLPSVLKAGFYGLVLYDSHLVFFKVKKTNVYEPRHWLPLRLFDLQKVADGEGTLPYAFRMVCRDHTFEVGSLCHAEQGIWLEAIEQATAVCRRKWLEAVASNPIAIDENPVCSLPLDSATSTFEGVSPIITSSEFGVFPTSTEVNRPSVSRAGSIMSSNDEGSLPSTSSGFRPRLSLKPPAQRVGVDLRLADLLSPSILSARAQSKRSHAMPLHGPPPRAMTTPSGMVNGIPKRPHSFHPASFSYRTIIDSTISSSRRTSMAESDGSRSSVSLRPVIVTAPSSSSLAGLNSSASEDTLRRKPTKLRRSRTSTQVSDQEATDATTKPQRRNSTLGKLRRRATSLASDSAPMKALQELRQQEQEKQQAPAAVIALNTQAGPVAVTVVAERPILDESVQATVARNSSTSSSSSYASTSTDPSLGNSLETPQSSLPASPLLTPVDLETQSRWTKIGDALSHTLLRKRSFASQRPTLSIPPEPLLEGIQLEQAQDAAEFIYTGRDTCGSNCSHSGTQSAATSSHSYERRYSWDRVGWSTLTASGTGTRSAYGSHHRTTSGLSAPPSMNGGASQPNIFGGRSAPNLSSMADKRQASSGSLWSVFGAARNGDSMHGDSSSPAPSIYEEAQDSAESSVHPSPAGHFIPLPEIAESVARATNADILVIEAAGRAIPITRTNPLGGSGGGGGGASLQITSQSMTSPSASTSSATSTSTSPSPTSGSQNLAPPPPVTRSGSLLKRRNSLSARLRAFKTLGSGMTPVRQQQPSRSYVT